MQTQQYTVTTMEVQFGPFLFKGAKRELWKNQSLVPLGYRAFDILAVLLVNAGKVIDNRSLVAAAWPDSVVEDSNLRVHIAALRKLLHDPADGKSYIENVPGRGYCFVAPLLTPSAQTHSPLVTPCKQHFLPRLLIKVIGRERELKEIAGLLPHRQLISICGPGGIGKTTLALAIAEQYVATEPNSAYFIDIGHLSNPSLMATHLASAMNITAAETDAITAIVAELQHKPVLLILDNCERQVEAVGQLAETLLSLSAQTHMLITSREPLRAAGEYVYPLQSLACAPVMEMMDRTKLTWYPACELFLQRVDAIQPGLKLSTHDVKAVASICQRLDGLPLALELAAARVMLFGFDELERRLDDRFNLLTKGRRSALPRHQTLKAMIDWSYETLTPEEAKVWRRLGVFAQGFMLEAVQALFLPGEITDNALIEILDILVAKSLVIVRQHQQQKQFWLLESMRCYSLERLTEHAELNTIRHLHAQFFRDRAKRPASHWDRLAEVEGVACYRQDIADIRQALSWAFAMDGQHVLAVQLTVESAPVWFKAMLLPEIRIFLEKAWPCIERYSDPYPPELVAKLCLSLGHAIFHSQGPGAKVRHALANGVYYAQQLTDADLHLRLLWSLYAHAIVCGEYDEVSRWTLAYGEVAAKAISPAAEATCLRTQTIDHHLHARHPQSLEAGAKALNHPAAHLSALQPRVFFYDHRVATSAHYARALWLSGQADQALALCDSAMELALQLNQPFATGYFLVCGACPVAIWSGDFERAEYFVNSLQQLIAGLSHNVWKEAGLMFRKALSALQQGDHEQLQRISSDNRFYADTLSTFHWQLLSPVSLARLEQDPQVWCAPELLRMKGESLFAVGDIDSVCDYFSRAYQLAKTQQAVAWQFRAAISLVKVNSPGSTQQLRELLHQLAVSHQGQDLQLAQALLV